MSIHREDEPLRALFSDLTREIGTLVRKEVELAQVEVRHNVSHATTAGAVLAIGGVILFGGFIVLLDVIALLLVERAGFSPVEAGAIVALSTLILGTILLLIGRAMLKRQEFTPRRALEAWKRDARLAQERAVARS